MLIKKINHCCFTITTDGIVFITDPGSFVDPVDLLRADVLLLSHEHGDHYQVENIQKLLDLNPDLKIYTNESVYDLLQDENIESEIMTDGDILEYEGITIRAVGEWHEEIYNQFGMVKNIGFYINEKVFFPGDAFNPLDFTPEVAMFCIAGPFTQAKKSIVWAGSLGARVVIPMHESILVPALQDTHMRIADHAFAIHETQFVPLSAGGEYTHIG
ncbi:MBL fold metallo-hydrolase [Candidatus Nomurabacteria bacterium]|nr:MBL fold metallo-hydrolase [Candidatus Nomurabacteria bacterium]